MGIKVMHCADVHIGAHSGIRKTAKHKKEVLSTFLRIVALAQEKGADLLLIAGDLFESHNIDKDVLVAIKEAFSSFSGRVFISPGNHDFWGENTFWNSWELPENVKVFSGSKEIVAIPSLSLNVFGGAFSGVYREDGILKGVRMEDDTINIGVIHADLMAGSPYCPVSLEDIKNSNMDYIALGHIHKRTEILKEGKTFYAYCGCPEGQGFDETGEKGVYFGTVEKGKAEMEFIPVCRRRFIEESVDISSAKNKRDIVSIILSQIKEKYGDEGNEWFYKIILTGETAVAFSTAEISAGLEDELNFAKVKNRTKAPMKELSKIAEENTVRGLFVRKMLEREALGEDISEALKIGLCAFSEGVEFDED
ncbi:MAG: metallophosphoesterase [Clostridia bacterium]|nr:metallophosphoesterase [Clostridia bacterium]